MTTGDFLNIHPTELNFPLELRKQSSCSMQLTNRTDEYVAFKVKTTHPKKYSVRPNSGIILPGSSCNVIVTMQALKEAPADMQCKDKFLLQSIIAPNSATNKDISSELFNKDDGKVVKEFKLRVAYIPANPPSPVPKGSEEDTSPWASFVEDGNQNTPLHDSFLQTLKIWYFGLFPNFTCKSYEKLESCCSIKATSTGDFLNIHPSELKFPFELRKQSSCSMQLTNKIDEYVAFKFKTTSPKKYCVRPNSGIILPGLSCSVTVALQALKETPADMQCKDKFLLQSVIAPNAATNKDISSEMFNKDDGKVVKEFKLRVVYIPANPPSPVPKGSEEDTSPRAFFVEDGNQNAQLHDSFLQTLKIWYFGLFPNFTCKSYEKLESCCSIKATSTGDFLNIHPSELKFPFELRKQSSCSMQLTNKIDEYVAFKFKTTSPKKYCVRPNSGIILPGLSCSVTVTKQALKETPANMQCKDKFLLQSVIATNKDISSEMFNKEEGKAVEEFQLRVAYIPANPPSDVPAPGVSFVEDGCQNAPLHDAVALEIKKNL